MDESALIPQKPVAGIAGQGGRTEGERRWRPVESRGACVVAAEEAEGKSRGGMVGLRIVRRGVGKEGGGIPAAGEENDGDFWWHFFSSYFWWHLGGIKHN